MRLVKISQDHYVVVDDSEIKVGDIVLETYIDGSKGVEHIQTLNDIDILSQKKITHSTQPLYKNDFWAIRELKLSEVKELIGEVDVERKSINSWEGCDSCDTNDELFFINGYQKGYNQAIEDKKDKKWTDEDVIYFVNKSRETGLTAEYLMMTRQPKTEWEVELIDGQLKLKQ